MDEQQDLLAQMADLLSAGPGSMHSAKLLHMLQRFIQCVVTQQGKLFISPMLVGQDKEGTINR